MQLKLNRYLKELRKNAIQFERIDINGKEDKRFLTRNFRRIICTLISLVIFFLLKSGFNSSFVAYSSTVLSILIGLFISAIIFSFDKFYQISSKNAKQIKLSINKDDEGYKEKEYNITLEDISQLSSKEKLWSTQSFNYAKQFAYQIGYSIVLSVFTITLLSFSAIFETTMSINIWDYYLDLKNTDLTTILNFLNVSFVIIQRFFVIYWIGGIIYNTLFAVSSMVNFMTAKLNRDNDTN